MYYGTLYFVGFSTILLIVAHNTVGTTALGKYSKSNAFSSFLYTYNLHLVERIHMKAPDRMRLLTVNTLKETGAHSSLLDYHFNLQGRTKNGTLSSLRTELPSPTETVPNITFDFKSYTDWAYTQHGNADTDFDAEAQGEPLHSSHMSYQYYTPIEYFGHAFLPAMRPSVAS
jgi:hypothetical protein